MPFRSVKVTAIPTKIAAYHTKRISITIFNKSETVVYFSEDPTGILENGFPIPPGSSLTLTDEDGDYPEREYYAQVSTGEAEIRIQEGYLK